MDAYPKLPEQHPGEIFFERIGLSELAEREINYHGRSITARDYFLQPDVAPEAKAAFDAFLALDATHPQYEAYQNALRQATLAYLGTDRNAS